MTGGDESIPAPDADFGANPLREVIDADAVLLSHRLAEAYFHDPVHAWMFPDVERRLRRLRRYFGHDLRDRLLTSSVGQTTSRGVACAFWLPPGVSDAPPALFRPVRSALRARRLGVELERQHVAEPHWQLARLAVAPTYQGQGIGRQLIEEGFKCARRDGMPIYADCTDPAVLPFFQRLGFTVAGTAEIPSVPPVFLMSWSGPGVSDANYDRQS